MVVMLVSIRRVLFSDRQRAAKNGIINARRRSPLYSDISEAPIYDKERHD
jgi:hypothetical protein